MKFLDLFEEVRVDEEYIIKNQNSSKVFAEFPLDFSASTAYSLPKAGNIPERHIEADYIAVPILDGAQTEEDAARLVIAVAADRDMAVFDSQAQPGEFSQRLVAMMKQIFRKNSGINSSLTDLFINEKVHQGKDDICGVKIHPVDGKLWDELEAFYKNLLGGSYDTKLNIVIGVENNRNDSFVRPVRKLDGTEGLAILNNKKVLLGLV